MKYFNKVVAFAALGVSAAWGQSLDSSGNGMLKGTYQFRLLEGVAFDQNTADITEAVGASGQIKFDGAGNYTITASSVVDSVGASQTASASGTYVIGAGGFGYIVNPLDSTDYIYGGVGQSVFVGSSTEGSYDNTFIAIPTGAAPTNASFTASYQAGLIDFPSGSSIDLKNALFELTPNGSGTFGTITLNGQAENQSASTITQTVTGATYTFPGDGSISLNVPLPGTPTGTSSTNALFTGARTMFVSADGNFILGYTPGGYDLVFGVKALTSNATSSIYSGLYYLSALEDDPSFGSCDVDSFYGSLKATSIGEIIHERLTSPCFYAYDYETADQVTFNSNGTATDGFYNYAFGDGGQAFVAIGSGGYFSLFAGVQASIPATGTGVYLDPIGITNAASFAPITASVAPGEWIALFGSGLSNTTQNMQGGQAFPPNLGGVQVLVNGTLQAPIYSVSPTQINAILPYELSTASSGIASIQVSNNGTLSSPVTLFISDTMPGVFAYPTPDGLGLAAARHASTAEVVNEQNPAVAGEYLEVFLTGLGTVTPQISDGAVSPSNPPSDADVNTAGNLSVYFDDSSGNSIQGNVIFAGLAPTLTGVYQMNVQVPSGLATGDTFLELDTDSAQVIQIQVPVGSSSAASVAANERTGMRKTRGRGLTGRTRGAQNPARSRVPVTPRDHP